MNITRITDIVLDFKLLPDVLEQEAQFFVLDIAALSAKREVFDIERWLESAASVSGGNFVRAALQFIGHKVTHDLNRQDQDAAQAGEPTTLSLTAPIIATFLRALRSQ